MSQKQFYAGFARTQYFFFFFLSVDFYTICKSTAALQSL